MRHLWVLISSDILVAAQESMYGAGMVLVEFVQPYGGPRRHLLLMVRVFTSRIVTHSRTLMPHSSTCSTNTTTMATGQHSTNSLLVHPTAKSIFC